MKTVFTAIVVIIVFGPVFWIVEEKRLSDIKLQPVTGVNCRENTLGHRVVRAPGRVLGRTENIELRSRILESIATIHVVTGQMVAEGDILISLEASQLLHERDLAKAMLAMAEASRLRLENGFRGSEIETSRHEYGATLVRLDNAEKSYTRGVRLFEHNAISQQDIDELTSGLNIARALAAAAKGRLATMELPAREDDLMAACAAVQAAQLRLKIAQGNLDRTRVLSPINGQVLSVDAEVGELTGPESPEPLIVMANTSQLRVVAEIDEFDSLRVRVGQVCRITSDASSGLLAHGRVSTIEPRMKPKRLFGQWAGERTDISVMRIWIDLVNHGALPIGLPVEVTLNAS
jgi:multidrug resistance efflux pump